MKKCIITFLSCGFVAFLLLGMTTAFAAASPNYARNQHEDLSIYYYGYVQCKPSYIENGNHAVCGYIRYMRYDIFGNLSQDSGRVYTEKGKGPSDSRILSRNYTFTDSIIPNPRKTQFYFGFEWYPAGTGSWPFSASEETVTE